METAEAKTGNRHSAAILASVGVRERNPGKRAFAKGGAISRWTRARRVAPAGRHASQRETRETVTGRPMY